MRIVFVTPAWSRFDLSAVCFAQRAWLIDELAHQHIEAQCVVVADDGNLDLAEHYGFATIERDNSQLGARFNDGYQWALAHGADFVMPVGSDTWLHPELFDRLQRGQEFVTATRSYAVVRQDGQRIAELDLGESRKGAPWRPPVRRFAISSWAFPADLLAAAGGRPCEERLMRRCDGSAFNAVERATGKPIEFRYRRTHPLAVVAFRSDVQITPYDRLVARYAGGERPRPFERLRDRYPDSLVDAAERIYSRQEVTV